MISVKTIKKKLPNKTEAKMWETRAITEKKDLRNFWRTLSEKDRKSLVKIEKDTVLQRMKDQQRNHCNCSTCGRKKGVIEEELEMLYDAYYQELELFSDGTDLKTKPLEIGMSKLTTNHGAVIDLSNSLTAKGGILTLADDFLKNDGSKFLDLMEQLAERKLRQFENSEEEFDDYEDEDDDEEYDDGEVEWDDGYDDEDYDDEALEDRHEYDIMTEQDRINEGRRMFQLFAAKMFEQRVLHAYQEKVSEENSKKLLAELEEEERVKAEKEELQLKKKEAKRLLKQKKEEERQQKEQARLKQEEAARIAAEAKAQKEKIERELERNKRELEKQKQDLLREQERLKSEEKSKSEKEKKESEEKKRKQLKELRDKEKKDKARIDKELRAQEEQIKEQKRIQKEIFDKSQEELRVRKEKERHERQRQKLKEEQEERERIEAQETLERQKKQQEEDRLRKQAELDEVQSRLANEKLLFEEQQRQSITQQQHQGWDIPAHHATPFMNQGFAPFHSHTVMTPSLGQLIPPVSSYLLSPSVTEQRYPAQLPPISSPSGLLQGNDSNNESPNYYASSSSAFQVIPGGKFGADGYYPSLQAQKSASQAFAKSPAYHQTPSKRDEAGAVLSNGFTMTNISHILRPIPPVNPVGPISRPKGKEIPPGLLAPGLSTAMQQPTFYEEKDKMKVLWDEHEDGFVSHPLSIGLSAEAGLLPNGLFDEPQVSSSDLLQGGLANGNGPWSNKIFL